VGNLEYLRLGVQLIHCGMCVGTVCHNHFGFDDIDQEPKRSSVSVLKRKLRLGLAGFREDVRF